MSALWGGYSCPPLLTFASNRSNQLASHPHGIIVLVKAVSKADLYRQLPSIDELLKVPELAEASSLAGHSVLADAARAVVERLRSEINRGDVDAQQVETAISSIGDASFSVEVKKGPNLVTVEFLIDDETKIVGKLEIGSAATVDYRTDGGSNIARHIVVRSAIHSY